MSAVLEHGKLNTYVKYGCRCDECRAVYAGYKRNYNLNRRQPREVSWGIVEPGNVDARPLEDLLTRLGDLLSNYASGTTVARWRAHGIPLARADALACRIGRHPSEVWEGWYAL